MIDIHCHILPGVDDGAENLREALLMARTAHNSGTKTMIATPHFGYGEGRNSAQTIREHVNRLQQEIRKNGMDLTLLPGMELLCTGSLEKHLEQKDYIPLADSHYLLTEFYFDESAHQMDRMISAIAERGLCPVIAHPERYDAVQQDPVLVKTWAKQGYGIQINAGSLLGKLGIGAQRTAQWLVYHGYAHAVASDAHGMEVRTPQLDLAWEYLEDHFGEDCAQALLLDTPRRILADLPLPRYF